jgi:hypothetical protein
MHINWSAVAWLYQRKIDCFDWNQFLASEAWKSLLFCRDAALQAHEERMRMKRS